jgi:hypothetical protein
MPARFKSFTLRTVTTAMAAIAPIVIAALMPWISPASAQSPAPTPPQATATASPTATAPRVFGLVAAVGDQFQHVRQKESVGTHLEPYARRTLTVPDQVLNYAVLRGLDRAVGMEFPESERVLMAMRPDPAVQLALPQDRESIAMEGVMKMLQGNADRARWDQIIVVTPKWLMSERQGMGAKLSGLGLYVQPLGPLGEAFDEGLLPDAAETTDRESTTSKRFVAPFFYVQVTTLDAKTLKVIKSESRFDFRKIVNKESAALDVEAAFTPEQLASHIQRFVETSALRSISNQSSSVEIGTVRTVPEPPKADGKK